MNEQFQSYSALYISTKDSCLLKLLKGYNIYFCLENYWL